MPPNNTLQYENDDVERASVWEKQGAYKCKKKE